MRRGRITGEMTGVEANEEKLMELMALDKQDAQGQDAQSPDAERQAQ
jgi:inositol transport system ATP-binding protein